MIFLPVNNKLEQLAHTRYELFFDSTGNVYVKNLKTNRVYMLLIDNTNNIILVHDSEYVYREHQPFINKLKLSSDPTSLKGKVIIEKQKENNNNGEEDNEDSDVEENIEKEIDIVRNLYPEDMDYYQEENDYLDEFDDDDYFQFASVGNNNIYVCDTDEYTATYDTLVYEGSFTSVNNMIYKTTYCGIPIPYRLLIFSNGDFVIRTIGEYQIHNKLAENEHGEPYFVIIAKQNISFK